MAPSKTSATVETMASEDRLSEVAQLLLRGLRRYRGECVTPETVSLAISPDQSVHGQTHDRRNES